MNDRERHACLGVGAAAAGAGAGGGGVGASSPPASPPGALAETPFARPEAAQRVASETTPGKPPPIPGAAGRARAALNAQRSPAAAAAAGAGTSPPSSSTTGAAAAITAATTTASGAPLPFTDSANLDTMIDELLLTASGEASARPPGCPARAAQRASAESAVAWSAAAQQQQLRAASWSGGGARSGGSGACDDELLALRSVKLSAPIDSLESPFASEASQQLAAGCSDGDGDGEGGVAGEGRAGEGCQHGAAVQ